MVKGGEGKPEEDCCSSRGVFFVDRQCVCRGKNTVWGGEMIQTSEFLFIPSLHICASRCLCFGRTGTRLPTEAPRYGTLMHTNGSTSQSHPCALHHQSIFHKYTPQHKTSPWKRRHHPCLQVVCTPSLHRHRYATTTTCDVLPTTCISLHSCVLSQVDSCHCHVWTTVCRKHSHI